MQGAEMKTVPDLQQVLAESRQFPALFESLHLASCDAAGLPRPVMPLPRACGRLLDLYQRAVGPHGQPGRHGRCSVLFIESEAQAQHLFARRRLTLQCTAHEHERGSERFELMDGFEARFGPFSMLRRLGDFHLYALHPHSGSYVAGFARAYTLQGEDLGEIAHRREQGHRSPDARCGAPWTRWRPERPHVP
jgi:putative heme iron utilization protein